MDINAKKALQPYLFDDEELVWAATPRFIRGLRGLVFRLILVPLLIPLTFVATHVLASSFIGKPGPLVVLFLLGASIALAFWGLAPVYPLFAGTRHVYGLTDRRLIFLVRRLSVSSYNLNAFARTEVNGAEWGTLKFDYREDDTGEDATTDYDATLISIERPQAVLDLIKSTLSAEPKDINEARLPLSIDAATDAVISPNLLPQERVFWVQAEALSRQRGAGILAFLVFAPMAVLAGWYVATGSFSITASVLVGVLSAGLFGSALTGLWNARHPIVAEVITDRRWLTIREASSSTYDATDLRVIVRPLTSSQLTLESVDQDDRSSPTLSKQTLAVRGDLANAEACLVNALFGPTVGKSAKSRLDGLPAGAR